MAQQFDPLNYNYELVSSQDDVARFQKILVKKDCVFTDIIELSYWKRQNTWIIFIEFANLQQFLPKNIDISNSTIDILPLFVGDIKSAYEYELLMKRIVKDPKMLVQLGC